MKYFLMRRKKQLKCLKLTEIREKITFTCIIAKNIDINSLISIANKCFQLFVFDYAFWYRILCIKWATDVYMY